MPYVKEDCEKAIKKIQQLYRTLKGIDFKPPNMIGSLGELLVMREMVTRGIDFEPAGGQVGYDITVTSKEGKQLVEVKTSTLKKWYGRQNYGWVVQRRGGRERKFDILLCAGIRDIETALNDPLFYIISGVQALKADSVTLDWVTSVEKKLNIFPELTDVEYVIDRLGKKDSMITKFDRKVNENLNEYENAWYHLTE